MPAKIVYGKKKSQASKTNFNKLLSPEKDAHSTDVDGLGRGLGDLKIAGDGADGAGEIQGHGKGKVKEGKDGRGKKPTKSVEDELEMSMGKLALGGEEDHVRDEVEKNGVDGKKKVGTPRKALEVRDTCTAKDLNTERDARSKGKKKTSKERRRKRKEEAKANVQTAHTSTPTPQIGARVRTPRQTPQKSPKPKRRVECTPAARPQPPLLLTPEPTPEPEDIYSAYVCPLLSFSDRKTLLSFDAWAKEIEPHFAISKIAEASFSEVYRLSSTSPNMKAESVLKVVALKTPPSAPFPCQLSARAVRDRNAQLQKEQDERFEKDEYKSHVSDVLSEVRLLQNLTPIPGFTVFRSLSLLRGRPSSSQAFTSAWHAWNRARPRGKKSEFPDPAKKSSYDDTQLWAVIEMQDAGTDVEKLMEAGGLKSVWEVWDVFWGVACSIAKAEEGVRFEHRDLHLGNICVKSVHADSRTGASTSIDRNLLEPRILNPLKRKMRFSGLETTVIDYTLSRADIIVEDNSEKWSPGTQERGEEKTGQVDVAYTDLDADPALFQGDSSEEYQYAIYRYMRGAALFGNPLQHEPTRDPTTETYPEQEQEHEAEQGPNVALPTPNPSPRQNTHIRFDTSDSDENDTIDVQPRTSPKTTTPDPQLSKQQITPPHDQNNPSTTKNPWQSFHPQTNLVWLHFLLHKLLTHLRTHNTTPSALSALELSAPVVPTTPPDAPLDAARIKKKAGKLYDVLERVSGLLCPVALGREGAVGSVKEVVVRALEERWVGIGDVEGC
ncbi:hypothetical protein J1614_001641 [Plenodomus biglobosus]|nr:hypothetical protein J1614_001641 [Plenodomus biglobosus]